LIRFVIVIDGKHRLLAIPPMNPPFGFPTYRAFAIML
jgi:hypothetical protein